ncbi:GGDEF domain-containing protein [Rhizobium sp. G21]|uniref:GGDEF domain-containing protein n=1 Tax=Rhizobium sp. G21 TaxID=2758439 RepID=UPI00160465AD|nr:GGDEF domain-containing protein [Rhizobium sp. G21]MBB1248878.1 GGDEF domain-containing protein [Rhizobium sp. G21]
MKVSNKILVKSSAVAVISAIISVSICLFVVPLLGGAPDGPGFVMSIVCPLVIAWPASAYQFSQTEKIRQARDELARAHADLDRLHGELTRAHDLLAHKARIDGLTGGLNRDTFLAMFETACGKDGCAALLLCDADHFKKINDAHGHLAGDEALRGIARAIARSLRPFDFWGRVGGEEFAIFLDGADDEEAFYVADQIRSAVQDMGLAYEGRAVKTTLSIGAAIFEGPGEALDHYRFADRRLYRAKTSGRNRIVLQDADEAEAA